MSELTERVRDALAGRYDIDRELGRGAMAVVFLARDVRHERQVALKVLRPEIAASLGKERFTSEILSVAQLNHPHILPLYDSGEAEGFLFYVMPYVEGESLQDRLRREAPLAESEAVRIAVEVAQGLDYAHKRGLIHRDIKPANIMLADGHALIADFGLARAVDRAGASGLTQTGAVVGTPVYMSPEQFNTPEDLDGRGDLYSLSCVAFEMLTGRPPYEGSSAISLLASHTTGEIPSVRQVRPEVSERVEAAVLTGLAKAPEQRYATTGEFVLAVTTGDGLQVPPRRRPTGVRALARRWGFAAGAVAFAAAALVVSITSPPLLRPVNGGLEGSRVVVASLENITGLPELASIGDMGADWITQGLHQTGIVDVIPSPAARQASRFVERGLADGSITDPVGALAQETSAGIVIAGRYYSVGDSLYFQVDITNAVTGALLDALPAIGGSASEPLEAVQNLRGQVMGSLAVNLDERLEGSGVGAAPPSFAAYQAFNRGLDAYIDSEWQTALQGFHEAFELDTTFAVPMLYAALSHSNLGQFVEADLAVERIVNVRSSLSTYHRYWLEHLEAMFQGDRERALDAIRRASDLSPGSKATYNAAWVANITRRPQLALDLLERLDPERGPMRGWMHYWVQRGDALHVLERHEEELAVARAGLAEHPTAGELYRVEAAALIGLGRIDEAVAVADSLLRIDTRVESPGFMALTIAHELAWHGAEDEAARVVGDAIDWYERLSERVLAQPNVAAEYAEALLRDGRLDEALAIWERLAVQLSDRWQYRLGVGVVAARLGDEERGRATSQALAEVDDPHARGSNTRMRASIAVYLGQRDEAIRLLRQSYEEGVMYGRHIELQFMDLRGEPAFDQLAGLIRSN